MSPDAVFAALEELVGQAGLAVAPADLETDAQPSPAKGRVPGAVHKTQAGSGGDADVVTGAALVDAVQELPT